MSTKSQDTVSNRTPEAKSSCPSAEEILLVVEGKATSADREALNAHLGTCGDCAELLASLDDKAPKTRLDRSPDCATRAALARFVHGGLPEPERQRLAAHLAGCPQCQVRLRHVAAGEGQDETEEGAPHTMVHEALLPAGARAGRFVVEGVLGQGGMGVVYRAADPELGRSVALKLVRQVRTPEDLSDRRARAVREAQAMARLNHPNVVQIFEIGAVDQGLFIAMELVDGETLARWCKAHPRTPKQILQLLLEAGKGLAAAHSVGIVHRDFKPDNVLVGRDGRARVTDFGLARLDTGPSATSTASPSPAPEPEGLSHHTAEGLVIGTPAFMAPEQMTGAPIDVRCDQFSFCVTAFVLLAGRSPFAGTNRHERLAAIEAGRFEPPPDASPISRRVLAVLHRGMAAHPGDRFVSMDALLDALRPKPLSRRVVLAGASIAAVASVVAAWRWQRKPLFSGPVTVAIGDLRNFTGVPQLDSLTELLASLLQSEQCDVLPRSLVLQSMRSATGTETSSVNAAVIARTASTLRTQVALLPVLRLSKAGYVIQIEAVHATRGETYFGVELTAPDQASLAATIGQLARLIHARLVTTVALTGAGSEPNLTRNVEAFHFYANAERLWANQDPDAVIVECKKALALDPDFAIARYRLATALAWIGNASAREQLEPALVRVDRLPWKEGRFIEALDLFLRHQRPEARRIWTAILDRHPRDREALWWMADSLFHELRSDDAVVYFDRLLEVASDYRPGYEHGVRANLIAGRFSRAVELARISVGLNPRPLDWVMLAASHEYAGQQGQADEAMGQLRQLMRSRTVHPYEADLEVDRDRHEAFEKRLSSPEGDPWLRICRARLAVMGNRFAEADAIYARITDDAVEKDERKALALHHSERALAHWLAGHTERARASFAASFEHRVQADLTHAWLIHFVGVLVGDPRHDWLSTKLRASPESAVMIDAHRESDPARACAAFLRAAKGQLGTPSHVALYFGLTKALAEGLDAQAAELAQVFAQRRPDNDSADTGIRLLLWPHFLILAGKGHRLGNRPAQAQTCFERASRILARADSDAPALTMLADALRKR